MANESKSPLYQKVTMGANTILGITTASFGAGTYDLLDDTEFGDTWEQMVAGLFRDGTLDVSGKFKVDDTQGQDLLRAAFHYQSQITDIRFYVDNTSYYTPNSTTAAGGGLPANTPVSHVLITEEPTTSLTLNDLAQISFRGRIVGAMRLI